MTSVPKPLKFLRPFYATLEDIRRTWPAQLSAEKVRPLASLRFFLVPSLATDRHDSRQTLLASILSVLAMTYSDSGRRDTLHYRLISGSTEDPGLWGNEYVRHLAAELGEEYLAASTADDDEVTKPAEKAAPRAETPSEKEGATSVGPKSGISVSAPTWQAVDRPTLLALALEIVPFFLAHNAEADAVDLLLELEAIERIVPLVGKDTFARVCLYMVSCVPLGFATSPADLAC